MNPRASTLSESPPLRPQIVAATLVIVLLGALTWRRGVHLSPDVGTYSGWSDALLRAHFNFPQMLRGASSVFPPTLYSGFITVVALSKLLLGEAWTAGIVVLNVLSLGVVSALVLRLSWRLSGNSIAAWSAPVLVLICSDLWLWARYPLSDLSFVALSTLILVLLAEQILNVDNKSPLQVLAVIVLLIAATFYRPTGVLLWPAALFAFWMCRRANHSHIAPRPLMMLAALTILSVAAIGLHSQWMRQPASWPLHAFAGTMQFNANHYRLGEVVFDRPQTWHAPPVSLGDFAAISLDRWRWFWAFTYRDFSRSHNILNALFFLPAYILALWTLWNLARARAWSEEIRAVLWMLVISIWTVSLFHALVQVDYDWRYRLPILPPLIILAACGIGQLVQRTKFAR